MRAFAVTAVLVGAFLSTTAVAAASLPATATNDRRAAEAQEIERLRAVTWRWQRLMGRPLARGPLARLLDGSSTRRSELTWWRARARQARRAAQRPPHREAWLCIHRHEGRWNDPDPPYFGGLQMSLQFQRAFGRELLRRKGTADKWTPLEQIWVAVRAHRSGYGFRPWPNTARMCGLL